MIDHTGASVRNFADRHRAFVPDTGGHNVEAVCHAAA